MKVQSQNHHNLQDEEAVRGGEKFFWPMTLEQVLSKTFSFLS